MNKDMWIFIIGVVVFLIGNYWDAYRTSSKFQWYGLHETNPLWKDQYGFFDAKKNLLWMIVPVAAILVIAFFFDYWMGAGIFLGVIGIVRFLVGFSNERKMKKERLRQTDVLTRLRQQADSGNTDPLSAEIQNIFRPIPLRSGGGRAWYSLFGWLWVEAPDQAAGMHPLRQKVIAHSQKPQTEWFPK